MLRFQGFSLDRTDGERLNAWAERLLQWGDRGLEDMYVLCHQPDDGFIPATVNLFLRALQMRGVMEPAPWRDLRPRVRAAPRALFDGHADGP